jgi:hypothetical protein
MEIISKKISSLMMLIVAFTFMVAFAHSTLAMRLIPPLSDIMYAQGEANCLDKGGFCMFSPMDCCGSMGCLIQWGYAFEDQNHVINVLSTSS